jgi:hypothetical protein
MIHYSQFDAHKERYEALPMHAARVSFRLHYGAQLAGYDPLFLDNLLAWCVVTEATKGAGVPDAPNDGYDIPTPLRCLWRSAAGLPLWAATVFRPRGTQATDIAYYHKRQQTGVWTGTANGRFNITPSDGRWTERRVPLPTAIAEWWEAECIGNANEIRRLLTEYANFVGKRRAVGFGAIDEWKVEECEEFNLIHDDRITRPLPAEAFDTDATLLGGRLPEGAPMITGWTPPQWKPALWSLGWRTGTPLEDDSPRSYKPDSEKATRLAWIMKSMDAGARLSKPQMAEKCGVSERTIERDLLDVQGAPLYYPLVDDGQGCYKRMGIS